MSLTAQSLPSNTNKAVIITAVIALHLIVFYAMESGLMHKTQVAEQVVNIRLDMIATPKPPTVALPPPPPMAMPTPPPVVPVPEVVVVTPPPAVTTAITQVATEQPVIDTPPVTATAPVGDVIEKARLNPNYLSANVSDYYPASSRRANEEGVPIVSVLVTAEGKIAEVKLLKSCGFTALDEAAVKYARAQRYLPMKRNGIPEESWFSYRINFKFSN